MAVASKQEAAFSPADVELFTQIAGQLAIAVENSLTYHELASLKNKLVSEKRYLEEEIQTEYNFEEIIGRSAALKKVLQQVATVAPTDSAVLLCGETGTGKELIAHAIHSLSGRRERTLVKLNCAGFGVDGERKGSRNGRTVINDSGWECGNYSREDGADLCVAVG
jgi:formate hydrogenlyase transcriptional activator